MKVSCHKVLKNNLISQRESVNERVVEEKQGESDKGVGREGYPGIEPVSKRE